MALAKWLEGKGRRKEPNTCFSWVQQEPCTARADLAGWVWGSNLIYTPAFRRKARALQVSRFRG